MPEINILYGGYFFYMRYLRVLILKKDKTIEWRNIGWGKYYLDQVRKEGDILMSFIHYS